MRSALVGLLMLLSLPALADEARDRGNAAAQGVRARLGTPEALQSQAGTLLFGGAAMQTADGESFSADIGCGTTAQFLSVSLLPNGTGDIDRLTVQVASSDTSAPPVVTEFAGPFAAVCHNGLVRCDAGTTTNCTHERWTVDVTGLALEPVPVTDLGACYCVNASCGAHLLLNNSAKVLDDIGVGITNALHVVRPDVVLARGEQPDAFSRVFFARDTGCGGSVHPEQFAADPGALVSAGQAIANQPDSAYHRVLTSDVARDRPMSQHACVQQRSVTLDIARLSDVVRVTPGPDVSTSSCGPGCLQVQVGRTGNDYWHGHGCEVFEEHAEITIANAARLTSAVLVSASYDNRTQVRVDEAVVYSNPASWTSDAYAGPDCNGGGTHSTLGQDHTALFTDGTHVLRMRTALSDDGEGWMVWQFRVDESCAVAAEHVDDGCASFATNPDCTVWDEIVDGVPSIREGEPTGTTLTLTPREIGGACTTSITRDAWQTQRTYRCMGAPRRDAVLGARERADRIHATFDPATGQFTDHITAADGSVSTPSLAIGLPPPESVPACTPTCKTRRPRPGVTMLPTGPTSALNDSGPAWDFTYRTCEPADTCPLEPGEEIVSACDCGSTFLEAAAVMQGIRMLQEDTSCEPE